MADHFDEQLKTEQINLRVQHDDSDTKMSGSSPSPNAAELSEKPSETGLLKSKSGVATLPKKMEGIGSQLDKSLAKRVPLKPKRTNLPIIIWILLIPVFAAAISLIADPTAPYILQRHLTGSFWSKESAEKLTAAINVRRDPEVLRDRASVYGYLQMFKEQEKDLQELIDRGYGAEITTFQMAKVRADQGIIDNKTKQLLRKTITDESDGGPNSGKERHSYDLDSAIWALTLLGDNKIASSVEAQDGYQDGAKQLIEGVATRELGDPKKANELFEESSENLMEDDYDWGGMPRYFKALLRLDQNDAGGAQKLMEKEVIEKRYSEYIVPTRELVKSWIAFAKGDLAQALSRSAKVIERSKNGTYGFGDLSRLSAVHYLRAHIYEQQGKKDLQAKELAAYKKMGAVGKVFVPKPYRNW